MAGLKRAFVLIGVKRSKTLPELNAVWDNVEEMREWAEGQGAKPNDIAVLTDQHEPVALHNIYDAVASFCDRGTIEQLVVYFSGHGINNARSEYWLLSDAVENSNAAVNLSGSMDIARYGVIPHVVFISDACRTAAAGIQAQAVEGGKIFPVKGSAAESRDIDVFYGTALGDASYEVQDVNEAVTGYRAVYTDALLLALKGDRAEVLKRSADEKSDFVHPRPLKDFLRKHVPIHLYELGIQDKTQRPDAIITSSDDVYISAFPVERQPTTPESSGSSLEAMNFAKAFLKESEFATDATKRMLDDWEDRDAETISRDIIRSTGATAPDFEAIEADKEKFVDEVRQAFSSFGPESLPNKRGIKIRGTRVVEVVLAGIGAELKNEGTIIELSAPHPTVRNVLLITEQGYGVVLPAFEGFVASLTFDEGRLLDLSFIPDAKSSRYRIYENRKGEIERLRGIIAASSRRGEFKLENGGEKLARRMQLGKGVDPSLALYAAHAYREQGNRRWLEEMALFLRNDLGACLFDVALLASTAHDSFPSGELSPVAPFAPLLSQSWPILQVREYELPERLVEISKHAVKDSLWTIYAPEGVELIRESILNGEIK